MLGFPYSWNDYDPDELPVAWAWEDKDDPDNSAAIGYLYEAWEGHEVGQLVWTSSRDPSSVFVVLRSSVRLFDIN